MAITINQQPPEFVTAWNPVQYHIQSTQTAQPGFRFIVTIKNTVNSDTIGVIGLLPLPGQIYNFLDISKHLGSYLSAYIQPTLATNDAVFVAGSWVKFHIVIQEFYNDAVQSTVNSSSRWAWNSVLPYKEWVAEAKSGASYVISSGSSSKFLSNYPNGFAHSTSIGPGYTYYPVGRTDVVQLSFNLHPTSPPGNLRFTTFDADFVQVDQVVKAIPTGANIFSYQFGINPSVMNTFINTSAAKYIKVEILDGVTVSSEMRLFEITEAGQTCYESYDMYFYNQLGGWEYWKMNLRSTKRTEIERNYFIKPFQTISATSVNDSIERAGQSQFFGKTKDIYTLNSSLVTPGQSAFLVQLAKSPIVFWNKVGLNKVVLRNIDQYDYHNPNDGRVAFITFDMEVDNLDLVQGV